MPAILLALAAMCFSGCSETGGQPAAGGKPAPGGPVTVVVTTGMIADAARIIGGERATVSALMGPGVDPHLYQPTARDQSKLSSAQIIFYNGLHLEGKMVEVFESLARKKACVAVTQEIPEDRLLAWASSAGMHDPHVWFDVQLWSHVVTTIAAEYARLDPDQKQYYDEQARQYGEELDHLDQYCRDRAQEIPTEQRVLITSHDAFHYFGKAYGFEVVGLQGISTESEAGLKAITDAIDLIKRRKIRAIFPETSVPRAAIERVARDSGASLGPELYSDALGEPDSPAGTYAGMIRTNIDNIVDALK
jgi:manganese/zinc/iron transport system substrate-binding protein